MKLVAVTACPTGIAHSQMAAESLEQTAKAEGHEITVEIQGAMGAENELSRDDIAAADAVIIAADTSVNRDRFTEVPVVKGIVKEGINDPEGLIERAQEAAGVDESEDAGAATARTEPEAGAENETDTDAGTVADADASMTLVAVTACPTGIAHSQMAAESLEQAAKNEGHRITVEIQGAMGAENELSDEEIAAADAVIIAADTSVNRDRFAGVPVVKGTVKEGINDPEHLLERAREATGKGATDTGTDAAAESDARTGTAGAETTTTEATVEGGVSTSTSTDTGTGTSASAGAQADAETEEAIVAGQADVPPDQVGGDPRKGLFARLKRLF